MAAPPTEDSARPATSDRARRIARFLRYLVFALAGLYLAMASIQAMVSYSDLGYEWAILGGLVMLLVFVGLSRLEFHPLTLFGIVVSAAVVWGLVSGSQPFSDFGELYRRAEEFARTFSLEPLYESKSTGSTLVVGIWMSLVGTSVASARVATALLLGVSSVSVALLGRKLGYPAPVWRFAGLALGLGPAFLIYSPVISTEAPLIASLTAAMYFFVTAYKSQKPIPTAVASGALFGFAYVSVPIGSMFAIGAFVVLAGRWLLRRTQVYRQAAAAFLIAVIAFPLAQTALNLHVDSVLSPSPSPWTAMALFHGTAIACDGDWCPADLEQAGYLDDSVPASEADRRALEIVRERWAEDPLGLLSFAFTAKLRKVWESESTAAHWATYDSPRYEDWKADGTYDLLVRGIDAFYFAVMLLLIPAMLVVWRKDYMSWPEAAIAFGIVASALMFVPIGAQSRYHLVFMPFLFLLLGIGAHETTSFVISKVKK